MGPPIAGTSSQKSVEAKVIEKVNDDQDQQDQDIRPIFTKLPIPPLIKTNIETWFLQLDSWFLVSGIKSDETKFNTLITCADGSMLTQVHNAVAQPPTTQKYENLKTAIISHFTDSEQKRVQQFVSGLQLGDKRPSHLLNELRKVGGTVDEQLVKNLWMQRLPPQAKTIIAAASSFSDKNLNELAAIADAVIESLELQSVNMATSSFQPTAETSKNSGISNLEHRINELTNMISNLNDNRSRSSYRRSHSKKRDNTPKRSENRNCFFHHRFGANARKCRPPCAFANNANQKN